VFRLKNGPNQSSYTSHVQFGSKKTDDKVNSLGYVTYVSNTIILVQIYLKDFQFCPMFLVLDGVCGASSCLGKMLWKFPVDVNFFLGEFDDGISHQNKTYVENENHVDGRPSAAVKPSTSVNNMTLTHKLFLFANE
jgi:hypothetical protein